MRPESRRRFLAGLPIVAGIGLTQGVLVAVYGFALWQAVTLTICALAVINVWRPRNPPPKP